MKIVSLELKNIRSYKKEKVSFPNGLVLLAGDIGSGKSTLLLAIEFALFGLRRGEISGGSLLRHGAKEGKVILTIDLRGEVVIIERGLKKSATSVGQAPGKVTVNGLTTDMTAVELRSKVLELLNYPESLLSQTKSLVFRYTVYTPQEDMKSILFEKPEERLDTMRKLFSIDKYKRIRENTVLVARELRTNIDRLRGQGDDLSILKKEQEELHKEQEHGTQRKKELTQNLEKKEELLKKERKKLEELEVVAKEREKASKEHAVTVETLHNAKNNLQRTQSEIHALKQETVINEEELLQKKKQLYDCLTKNKSSQQELQTKIDENNKNEAKVEAIAQRIEDDRKNITELDNCPTCKQPVTQDHKHTFTEEAKAKQEKISAKKKVFAEAQARLKNEMETLLQNENTIRKKTEALMQLAAKFDAYKKNELLRQQKQKQEAELQQTIQELDKELAVLTKEIGKDFDMNQLAKQRQVTREVGEVFQQAQLAHARHVEQVNALAERTKKLAQSIIEKQTSVTRADKLSAQHEWLTKHFSNLMFTIEKHVLMTLYHQFNDAFKEWFDALIEDDTISVRLDHDFTPLVEQNGYETMIENLSGGEKTSVALAYRLAINKVINQALQDLNTDGLLILDEPTDGFSSEQLDRVQEVLSKLELEQILIVSHEPKMESFMDHVIRVTKNEHESVVHL